MCLAIMCLSESLTITYEKKGPEEKVGNNSHRPSLKTVGSWAGFGGMRTELLIVELQVHPVVDLVVFQRDVVLEIE